jgi:hypothetical protein
MYMMACGYENPNTTLSRAKENQAIRAKGTRRLKGP